MAEVARILIVDDEAPQMKALCDTLEVHDYAVAGFTSGALALAAMERDRFDLMLSDLTMPEMDGIALLLAAQHKDPDLVSIIMTGAGSIASAVEAMKAGAFDYILKPFKVSAILPVISRALAMRRLRLDNAELERRVRQRTAELEAANRELETFSYSVSHDLRAPLRAINGFANRLVEVRAEAMPADERHLLERILVNSKRMGQLIEDLLRLSRTGRQTLAPQTVSLAGIVQEILEPLRREAAGRAVEVRVGDLPDCVGDPGLLRQVFANLLGNAFKYTGKKATAVIEVGARRQDGEVVYFVRDDGVGFDMAFAGRLFAPFQRLHHASEFEGTGIGLATVQRIIARHGGRIWPESTPGAGATFSFTLAPGGPG